MALQLEPSESASSSNASLAKPRPSSELNGQSPSHLKVQRSVSSNHKQRRYSEQGEPARRHHLKERTVLFIHRSEGCGERSVSDSVCSFRPAVGQNVPPGMTHPKRSQTTTGESNAKEEAGVQKPSTPGGRGAPPSSPLLGNANNPNKADIPDRRKGGTTGPAVSTPSSGCLRPPPPSRVHPGMSSV